MHMAAHAVGAGVFMRISGYQVALRQAPGGQSSQELLECRATSFYPLACTHFRLLICR